MTARIRRYLADAAGAFDRAPAEVVIAVVLAGAFSYALDQGGDSFRAWTELAVAGVLAFTAAWTATLLHSMGALTSRQRWTITAAGAAAAAVYALLVLDLERAAEGWRAALLVGAAVLWLTAAPVFGGPRAQAVDTLRRVDGRILLRMLGALLYSAALFAGLALALGAVNSLFELGLRGEIYGHVFGWIFLVLAPWIVIGGLSDYVQPLGDSGAVGGVVHRMTVFLVPPLLALYYLILYAYAVRIGVTGEVPKNMLSPMVLAAGVLAALALVLFEPAGDEPSPLRWLRIAPPLFLPLGALGVWAVALRVEQYGWTEFRLLRLLVLVVLVGLAAGAAIQLVRRRRFALHALPLALAGALLVAASPVGILPAARLSQQARLDRALAGADIDPRSLPDTTPRTVPSDVYERINSSALYLRQHFGPDALPPVLARRAVDDTRDLYDLAGTLGLRRTWADAGEQDMLNGQLPPGAVVRMADATAYRVMAPARVPGHDPEGVPPGGVVAVVQDSTRLVFTVAGERLTADLGSLLASGGRTDPRGSYTLGADQASLPVADSAGQRRGEVLILGIGLYLEQGVLRLRHFDGLLILPTAESRRPGSDQ